VEQNQPQLRSQHPSLSQQHSSQQHSVHCSNFANASPPSPPPVACHLCQCVAELQFGDASWHPLVDLICGHHFTPENQQHIVASKIQQLHTIPFNFVDKAKKLILSWCQEEEEENGDFCYLKHKVARRW
jgi:hypothetical protein